MSASLTSDQKDIRAGLEEEVARSVASFENLQRAYEEATSDPDVIQEDRSSARILAEKARHAINVAQEALAKFDRGDYGSCEKCGEPIPPERLEAIPDAITCRDCTA